MYFNNIIKAIILGCSLTNISNCFITPVNNNMMNRIKPYKLSRFMMTTNNNTFKNTSNIYKINFNHDNELENDWYNKPKYAFNMTEYDFTILKIYVYTIITIYCVGLMIFKAILV
jgi:hypothetical protein